MARIEIAQTEIVRLFNDVSVQPIGLDTETVVRLNKSAKLADLTDDWLTQWGEHVTFKKDKVFHNNIIATKRANASAWVGADYYNIKIKKAHTENMPIERIEEIEVKPLTWGEHISPCVIKHKDNYYLQIFYPKYNRVVYFNDDNEISLDFIKPFMPKKGPPPLANTLKLQSIKIIRMGGDDYIIT